MRCLFFACLALAGCRSPEPPSPLKLDLELPTQFAANHGNEPVVGGAWWQSFGSDELNQLVTESLEHNRDLRAAAYRIDAAHAQARIAGSARKPTVDLGASRNRQKAIFVGLPVPGSSGVLESTATSWGVSLDVAWEADLWGRLSATERAAEAQTEATMLDYEAARHSLAAQTAKAWTGWRLAAGLLNLAERTTATYERDLGLIKDRFEAGLLSSFDQRLAQARLEASHAAREGAAASVDLATRQLETLVGRYPAGALSLDGALPDAPPLPGVGVPSELLQRRPDLRAAAMRVASADASLEAAIKERYPRFVLSASAGRISDMVEDLADNDFSVWGILTSLAQPLYQGGRINAGIDLADANARALLESYAQTTLIAFLEVESALAIEQHLIAQEQSLGRALSEASAAREIAEDNYRSGLNDLSIVLEADRSSLDAERNLLGVRAARLDSRIDLYLALGGELE